MWGVSSQRAQSEARVRHVRIQEGRWWVWAMRLPAQDEVMGGVWSWAQLAVVAWPADTTTKKRKKKEGKNEKDGVRGIPRNLSTCMTQKDNNLLGKFRSKFLLSGRRLLFELQTETREIIIRQ